MFISFAILTASYRDFELPGIIFLMTELDFLQWKWFLISKFRLLMQIRNSFVGLFLIDRSSLLRRFSFRLIARLGLKEFELQLLMKGTIGIRSSIIGSNVALNLSQ